MRLVVQEMVGQLLPRWPGAWRLLSFYAERYPIVEVDSWRDRTPDGFGFSSKVPQVFTHEKLLTQPEKSQNCVQRVRIF
jgi:uncharacterized protein YecE (DUF72 family)